MSQYTIHGYKCDHCGRTRNSETLPAGWSSALGCYGGEQNACQGPECQKWLAELAAECKLMLFTSGKKKSAEPPDAHRSKKESKVRR